jgi:hypothetical protein
MHLVILVITWEMKPCTECCSLVVVVLINMKHSFHTVSDEYQ